MSWNINQKSKTGGVQYTVADYSTDLTVVDAGVRYSIFRCYWLY